MSGSPTLRELSAKFDEALRMLHDQSAYVSSIDHKIEGLYQRLNEQIEPRIAAVEHLARSSDDEFNRDKNGGLIKRRMGDAELAIKSLQVCFADVQTTVHNTERTLAEVADKVLAEEREERMPDVALVMNRGSLSTTAKIMRAAACVVLLLGGGGLGFVGGLRTTPEPQIVQAAPVNEASDEEKALVEWVKQQRMKSEQESADPPRTRQVRRQTKPKSGPIGQRNQWAVEALPKYFSTATAPRIDVPER